MASKKDKRPSSPAIDAAHLQNKLIALAYRQVENELSNMTASSQVTTHFLKLATVQAELEVERAKLANDLLKAKIKNELSTEEVAKMYENVMQALSSYTAPDD